jgi:dipeptidyl aminopeptidase/acylaminoacyl peptidase
MRQDWWKILIVVVLVVAASAVYVWGTTEEAPPRGLAAVGPEAFDRQGRLRPGPHEGRFSPDGTLLAVLSSAGVALAAGGETRLLTEPGSNVVDFAWFPDSRRILVAEGPGITGEMAAIDVAGNVLGSIKIDRPFSFGTGFGMAVDPTGTRAIVTAFDRPAFAGQKLDLVMVELATGQTTDLSSTGAFGESEPHFVDEDTVLFTQTDQGGRTNARLLELGGQPPSRQLSPAGERASALGALNDGRWVAYGLDREGRTEVWAVRVGDGLAARIGAFSGSVAAVDPLGRYALVRERSPDDPQAVQLRRAELSALPGPPDQETP